MKNKFEGFCYLCGGVVEEEKGIAERVKRQLGDPGWGETKWVVRHPECKPQKEINDSSRSDSKDGTKTNQITP